MFENPSQEVLRTLLKESKTIAVVGLSNKAYRTSYQISEAMKQAGYKIIPVNPEIKESLGEKAYASLHEIEEPIDIINVFRRSTFLPELAKEAKDIKAKAFWTQQGVYHNDVPAILEGSGKEVIMNNCIKVTHALLK
ncbi:CoA-binding protein [Halobacillus andaensis]|uniref:CoA-binding protein n=1 Tax=Halobacillus andaensis TaxID=1176239 RepID=A0A917EV62_HALAA|nr:CoA-binding protein [Halobacillus andaensis]MBP2003374.1 putative CoA-binding protein [Halobacillus andaensis]GGF10151.1 CoA-binding protein [Halobacillus andaensis]